MRQEPPHLFERTQLVTNKKDIIYAIVAFSFYIIGGIGTFAGLGLIFLIGDNDFMGWGHAKGIGYLFTCVGLCLSIMGVLMMRIFRNRGLS